VHARCSQVIQLTKDLLAEATSAVPAPSAPAAAASERSREASTSAPASHPAAAITSAPDLRLPSVLPPTVAAQIRLARQRAALSGQAPPEWAIGAAVQAVYREDGQWYNASISAVSLTGKFIVEYEGYEQAEELERGEVRLRGAEADGGYTGVSAPKRRKMAEEVTLEEMPAWLNIKPDGEEGGSIFLGGTSGWAWP
jgi:survival of motor neuron-related-splicing factor 30